MITLAIDTSTQHGSVALLSSAQAQPLLHERFLADRSHSTTLFLALERARAFLSEDRIDSVAIGLGPGSYAGVRIAIAAALGLQLGLGATLLGIPSVAALDIEPPEYLAIGDARRDAFYFTHVLDGLCVQGPILLTEAELRVRLEENVALPVFTCEEIALFPQAKLAIPCALKLARLAEAGRGAVQHDDLEPIYLREPHITLPKARPF